MIANSLATNRRSPVPRFHFNIYDGYSTLDTDGVELPDWMTARREAIKLAGVVVADNADRLLPGKDWRLEVTDDVGFVLIRLDFDMAETAAIVPPTDELAALYATTP